MWHISGMPTSFAACSAMSSGAAPWMPLEPRPTRTLMPMITSRFASATCTASIGAISRISSLSPTITVLENA